MISVMQTEQLESLSIDSKSPLVPCLLSINVTNIVKLPDKVIVPNFSLCIKTVFAWECFTNLCSSAPLHTVGVRAPPKIY